jgi:two-component system NtrC family sensor kinase
VVDDEPSLRELIARVLQDAGAEVVAAGDGESALAMVNGELQAVVSDVRMPGMGGQSFYQRCLFGHPDLARRFVFVTGDTASRETWEFLAETGCETLQKPFPNDALVEAVARAARLRP